MFGRPPAAEAIAAVAAATSSAAPVMIRIRMSLLLLPARQGGLCAPARRGLVVRALAGRRREPGAVRVVDRLRAVTQPGLREEVVDVGLHGRLRDGEALGDLGIREPLGD